MKKLHEILAATLLIILISALTSFIGVGSLSFAAESFESSDVLTDLNSMTVNGKKFDVADYPANSKDRLQVINLVEYGYSYKEADRSGFSLFVYLYNPAKIDIKAESGQNKIQLGYKYGADGNPTGFEHYDIQLCSVSENGLFLKYKVIDHVAADGSTIANRVNRDSRRYDVSGLYMLTRGGRLATEYVVGLTYNYSGFAAGLNELRDATSTLSCSYLELETVQLDVKDTYYRTGVSDAGYGHQNQINSVYFSVPKAITDKYGDNLYAVSANWYQAKTAPILVTDNATIYNAIKPYEGYDVGGYSSDVPYQLVSDYQVGFATDEPTYLISYNFNEKEADKNALYMTYHHSQKEIPMVCNVHKVSNLVNDLYGGDDIEEFIYAYNKTQNKGTFLLGDYSISKDLFEGDISLVPAHIDNSGKYNYNLLSFDSSFGEWAKYFIYHSNKVITSEEHFNILPIIQISAADLSSANASSELLINTGDLSEVSDYVTAAGEDKTYLFRFAADDYYSVPMHGYYAADEKAYIAQETVYLDFKVIDLTFYQNGEYMVVGAVSNPLNIIADITPPLDVKNSTLPWWMTFIFAISIVLDAVISLGLFSITLRPIQKIENKALKVFLGVLAFVLSVGICTAIIFCIDALIIGGIKKWDFNVAAKWLWGLLKQ